MKKTNFYKLIDLLVEKYNTDGRMNIVVLQQLTLRNGRLRFKLFRFSVLQFEAVNTGVPFIMRLVVQLQIGYSTSRVLSQLKI
jgi:hypothetical protein